MMLLLAGVAGGCVADDLAAVQDRVVAEVVAAEQRAQARTEALDDRLTALRSAYDAGELDARAFVAERDAITAERIAGIGTTLNETLESLRTGASDAVGVVEAGVESAKARARDVGFGLLDVVLSAIGGAGAVGAGLAGTRRVVKSAAATVNAERDAARLARGEATGRPA